MLPPDVQGRIRRLFSAQLFSQLVTIIVQLGLVPILLIHWGVDRYGAWLLISAVPTYLVFSDLGFTMVAKTRMMMHVNARDQNAAKRTFDTTFMALSVMSPLLLMLAFVVLYELPLWDLMPAGDVTAYELKLAMGVLLVNVVLFQYFMLVGAGVRCENRAATELVFAACTRLAEGAAIAISAMLSSNLVAAAGAALLVRAISLLLMYRCMRRTVSWLALSYKNASTAELKSLLHPALGFMLVPIAQALLIQGPVLVIGFVLGSAAIVPYSTTRTVTRVGTAASTVLTGAVAAEYSALFGRRDFESLKKIFVANVLIVALLALIYGISILIVKEPLMNVFTHGKVEVPVDIFVALVIAVGAEMLSNSVSFPLMSINRHIGIAYWMLSTSMLALVACYFLVSYLGAVGAAIAVALAQLSILGRAAWDAKLFLRPVLKTVAHG